MRATYASLVMLCAGCSIGPRAADHVLALSPAGVPVEIELATGVSKERPKVSGELLAVTDSGFWILVDHNPRWMPYVDIHHAAFGETGDGDFSGPRAPKQKTLEHLRLESRYPQGITPALLDQLIQSYRDSATRGNL